MSDRPTLATLRAWRADPALEGSLREPERRLRIALDELIRATEMLRKIIHVDDYHNPFVLRDMVRNLLRVYQPLPAGDDASPGPSHRKVSAGMEERDAAAPGQRMEGTAAPPERVHRCIDAIWHRWWTHIVRPRPLTQPALSMADGQAFAEIAQEEIGRLLAGEEPRDGE